MLSKFLKAAQPSEQTSVLDVGVTSNRRSDSNFFERHYPFPASITALGLDDASFLEQEFPGLKFVQGDALSMPFADRQFDLATSWATIEHVGSRARQKQFVSEMCRVSKRCLITTPNRWFPIEFHTVTPLIHWLPPEKFRSLLSACNMNFYANEETLNLLSENDFVDLLPAGCAFQTLHHRMFGLVSNLLFLIEPAS